MNTGIEMVVGPDPLQMLKLTTGRVLDFTFNISEKLFFGLVNFSSYHRLKIMGHMLLLDLWACNNRCLLDE